MCALLFLAGPPGVCVDDNGNERKVCKNTASFEISVKLLAIISVISCLFVAAW